MRTRAPCAGVRRKGRLRAPYVGEGASYGAGDVYSHKYVVSSDHAVVMLLSKDIVREALGARTLAAMCAAATATESFRDAAGADAAANMHGARCAGAAHRQYSQSPWFGWQTFPLLPGCRKAS